MRISGDPIRTRTLAPTAPRVGRSPARSDGANLMNTLAIGTTDHEVSLHPLLESMVLTLPAEHLEIHDGCVIVFDEEPHRPWSSTLS